MESRYNLTNDPIFYSMVVFLALLATALPAFGGAPRLMPLLQSLSLTVLAAVAIRQRRLGSAAAIAAIWFVVQFIVLFLLTWLFVDRVERSVVDGFDQRAAIIDWFYVGAPFPGSSNPSSPARVWSLIGVTLGSLLSFGFVGFWTVVRAVNVAGFHAGVLLGTLEDPLLAPATLPIWTLLRIAGSTGLVIVFAEPMLTRNWSPVYYVTRRRRILLVSSLLLGAGLLVEMVASSMWRSIFVH